MYMQRLRSELLAAASAAAGALKDMGLGGRGGKVVVVGGGVRKNTRSHHDLSAALAVRAKRTHRPTPKAAGADAMFRAEKVLGSLGSGPRGFRAEKVLGSLGSGPRGGTVGSGPRGGKASVIKAGGIKASGVRAPPSGSTEEVL